MVNLKIDRQEAKAKEGMTILEAAKDLGIDIPTLCYHKEISPYGACRLCTVEIKRGEQIRLQASCCAPVEEGIEVITNSERINKGRKMMLELLFSRCPKVKEIQELAEKYGISKPRFKPKEETCILCGLCTRVCSEIAGANAISFTNRGTQREVKTPFEEISETCLACGACTYVCPTGHIKMEFETVSNKLRSIPGHKRKCRYMLMGMLSYKLCFGDYYCWKCEVDQRMEDTFGIHPIFVASPAKQKELQRVEEFYLEPSLYYYPGHTWVKILNGKVRIGIDDFANKLVGRVNNLALPNIGSKVVKAKSLLEITCGTKNAKILFPIEGTIVDINSDIDIAPFLIKNDPYGRGWIADIEPLNLEDDLKMLFKENKAREWLKSEKDKLNSLSSKLGIIAMDGGEIMPDLPDRLTDREWSVLTKEFFLT